MKTTTKKTIATAEKIRTDDDDVKNRLPPEELYIPFETLKSATTTQVAKRLKAIMAAAADAFEIGDDEDALELAGHAEEAAQNSLYLGLGHKRFTNTAEFDRAARLLTNAVRFNLAIVTASVYRSWCRSMGLPRMLDANRK